MKRHALSLFLLICCVVLLGLLARDNDRPIQIGDSFDSTVIGHKHDSVCVQPGPHSGNCATPLTDDPDGVQDGQRVRVTELFLEDGTNAFYVRPRD